MTTPHDVASNLGRAWDAGDSVGMAAIFDVGADFVDVLGRRQKGREVIEREHRKLFRSIYAGSTCVFRVIATRSLGEGVLLVHTSSKLSVPAGPRQGDTFATQTMVMAGDGVRRQVRRAVFRTARSDDLTGPHCTSQGPASGSIPWRRDF